MTSVSTASSLSPSPHAFKVFVGSIGGLPYFRRELPAANNYGIRTVVLRLGVEDSPEWEVDVFGFDIDGEMMWLPLNSSSKIDKNFTRLINAVDATIVEHHDGLTI